VLCYTALQLTQSVRWHLLQRALGNYLGAEQVDFFSGTNQASVAIPCNLECLQSALQVLKKAALTCDAELQLNPDFLNCVHTGVVC